MGTTADAAVRRSKLRDLVRTLAQVRVAASGRAMLRSDIICATDAILYLTRMTEEESKEVMDDVLHQEKLL